MAAESLRHLRGRHRDQRGETLIEGLLAIAILGTAAVAAFGGLQTSVSVSSQHHESAVAETLLRTVEVRQWDPDAAGPVPTTALPSCGSSSTPQYLRPNNGNGNLPWASEVRFTPISLTIGGIEAPFDAGSTTTLAISAP